MCPPIWACATSYSRLAGFASTSRPSAAIRSPAPRLRIAYVRLDTKLGGVPVQIIREDSQLKPDVATQLVQKLIEKDQVPIITGITPPPTTVNASGRRLMARAMPRVPAPPIS